MPQPTYFQLRQFLSLTALGVILAMPVWVDEAQAQRTVKPVLHGKHWVAITGKPLAASDIGLLSWFYR